MPTPVGLFGFVRNTTRCSGVIAASTSSSGKAEVRRGHHLHQAPAGDVGVEAKDLERRLGHDRLGDRPAGRRPQIRDRQRHDPFVEAVGSARRSGVDAEVLRARVGRGRVRRIEPDLIGAQPRRAPRAPAASSRPCSRSGAAAGRRRAPAASGIAHDPQRSTQKPQKPQEINPARIGMSDMLLCVFCEVCVECSDVLHLSRTSIDSACASAPRRARAAQSSARSRARPFP